MLWRAKAVNVTYCQLVQLIAVEGKLLESLLLSFKLLRYPNIFSQKKTKIKQLHNPPIDP